MVIGCLFLLVYRLHGRYYEMAPNVVPMDYTKDPDVKLPMQLIINMPELKVSLLTAYKRCINFCSSSARLFAKIDIQKRCGMLRSSSSCYCSRAKPDPETGKYLGECLSCRDSWGRC